MTVIIAIHKVLSNIKDAPTRLRYGLHALFPLASVAASLQSMPPSQGSRAMTLGHYASETRALCLGGSQPVVYASQPEPNPPGLYASGLYASDALCL